MGKAGRIACIFTPMALTVASLICLILIEVSGWGGQHGQLNSYYFVKANFSDLSISEATTVDNTTVLTGSLEYARDNKLLANVYQIHLWNYCSSNSSTGSIDYCSPKHSDYYFNPLTVWHLNATNVTSTTPGGDTSSNPLGQAADQIKNNTEALENELLGKSGREALDAYRHVSKWMFIAYEISFWSTLATIVLGILAIFSRWGSFFTWIAAGVSSLFTFAAVLTSTILFGVFVGALKTLLDPYNVHIHLGTHALEVTWLAVAFNLAGTLFWLFSICCCAGSSNPHHKSNKGGLWNAEKKGQGYGDYAYPPPGAAGSGSGGRGGVGGFLGGMFGGSSEMGRGRSLRVEKTGGAGSYARVESPWMGASPGAPYGDRVPLTEYPQHQTGYVDEGHGHHGGGSTGAYEPFRQG